MLHIDGFSLLVGLTEGSSEAVGPVDGGSEEGVEGCSWESDEIAWAVLVGIL